MRLTDFAVVEFARLWQEEAGASSVDPEIVAAATGQGGSDDERLLGYASALLAQRVEEGEGRSALAQLRGALSSLYVLAPALGLLAGASLLAATLPPPDARPVNVFILVGEGILLPTLFGGLTVALSLGAGRALLRAHWSAWLFGLLARRSLSTRLGSLAGRVISRSGVAGPLFGSVSHLFWMGVLGSFVALAAWRFLFTDYLFSWSSTLPVTARGVQDLFELLAAPVGWLPGVRAPGPEQVAVSEWASLLERYAHGSGDPLRDEALRKGWYGLMLASVLFWGFLPRVLAFAGSRWLLAARIRAALRSPAHQAVLDALDAPPLTVTRDGDGGGVPSALPPSSSRALPPSSSRALPPSSSRALPPAPRLGIDVVAFACPPPREGALRRLRLERLGLSGREHLIPEDDDEPAMDAALAGMGGAGGAIVAFSVADSPGRLREAFLRDVVAAVDGGPVHLVLSGVDAFRESPRGRALADRLGAWRGLAERVGVPSERVHPDGEAR